jgi:hypothetical protein
VHELLDIDPLDAAIQLTLIGTTNRMARRTRLKFRRVRTIPSYLADRLAAA